MLRAIFRKTGRALRLLGSGLERRGLPAQGHKAGAIQVTLETPEWEKLSAWLPPQALRGWNCSAVAVTQKTRWEEFAKLVSSPGPLGIAFESDAPACRESLWAHNVIMTYGYVLGRVLRGKGNSLKMLDWGAGAGHYHEITRALYPQLEMSYTAFDVDELCRIGRQVLPQASFYSDSAAVLHARYDFVLAGSSLWYSEDWKTTLRQLAEVACPWIYVTRMIFLQCQATCIAIQRPQRWGYDTEYQCWILNRDEFLSVAADHGLRLEREFWIGPAPEISGVNEQGAFRGFLFCRVT